MNDDIRKLEIKEILRQSWAYMIVQWKIMGIFGVLCLFISLFSIFSGGVKTWGFWPSFLALYVLESVFFRFYFVKKPYISWHPLVVSLIPSVKVSFLVVAFLCFFAFLPFVPLLFGIPYFEDYIASISYADDYVTFLQHYMQDIPLIDVFLSLLLILISPWILFRPMLAWIAAVLGRRGSLRVAWRNSRGHYWQFVVLGGIILIPLMGLYLLGRFSSSLFIVANLLNIPIMIYFNIIMAKLYFSFYLE